ncbi:MAG: hypothetical protein KBS83_05415 [Lachnospiraceae bacterium]|nr:hypothetical protein [Candidatus Equihabitans merdae]
MVIGLFLSVFLPMVGGLVFLLMSFFAHIKETKAGGTVDVRRPASSRVHIAAMIILVISAVITL